MQQELQQSSQQELLQHSDVCDIESGTDFAAVVRRHRLQCMLDLGPDLASYSSLVVKMACDGIYRHTPRQGDELRRLAAEHAAAGGSCAGVRLRGTSFARLVKCCRDALKSKDNVRTLCRHCQRGRRQ